MISAVVCVNISQCKYSNKTITYGRTIVVHYEENVIKLCYTYSQKHNFILNLETQGKFERTYVKEKLQKLKTKVAML